MVNKLPNYKLKANLFCLSGSRSARFNVLRSTTSGYENKTPSVLVIKRIIIIIIKVFYGEASPFQQLRCSFQRSVRIIFTANHFCQFNNPFVWIQMFY